MVLAATVLLYQLGVDGLRLEVPSLLLAVAYNGMLDGGPTGQTFGKKLLRIRVVDDDTGGIIGPGRGMGRALVPAAFSLFGLVPALILLSMVLGLLDGLWPLWDQHRQTWHDKAVRSVVVVA